MGKTATQYDYQARAREFEVHDFVHPVGAGPMDIGRVSQVFAGIGMVQVEFPFGSRRYPVEDLEKIRKEDALVVPPMSDNVPGGPVVAPVSNGRPAEKNEAGFLETTSANEDTTLDPATTGPDGAPAAAKTASLDPDEIAHAYFKRALYWAQSDRNYRATKGEFESGTYQCPKCKGDDDERVDMKRAIYKMRDGERHRVYVCPNCTFIVKQDNIHTDHHEPEPVLASDRAKKVREVVKQFSFSDKKGFGEDASVMLTGVTARVLGKKEYASVKMGELSDEQVDKLHKLLVKKEG